MKESGIITLSNGIRVVHTVVPSGEIVHCGIFLEIGSRDETEKNQGIAHFWEHMAFKGTKRRRAFHVINSLDSVGGDLNAYTEKEKIVFYASIRAQYLERAVDILTDIAFYSVFPEKEIEKERGVILEEMSMYLDDPDDSLQDEFEATVFQNHPLGMNILGSEETVKRFTKKDFITFVRQHLNTHKIVVSFAGNVTVNTIEKLSRKYLEKIPSKNGIKPRQKFSAYKPREIVLKRPIKQARIAIGREAYPLQSKNRIPFFLLVNLLGGPGMNSRLNLALREKYGFVYSIDANYTSYSDTGLFSIYFGTEPSQTKRCIQLIKKEMDKLTQARLGERQLNAVKEQVKGHLAMSEESNLSIMLMMGRSILDFGKVPTLKEVYQKIDDVDAATIHTIAQHMFNLKRLSCLIMEPGLVI